MSDNLLNIVIIGGSVAGVAAATRVKRLNENAQITLIEEGEYIGYSRYLLCAYACAPGNLDGGLLTGMEEKLTNIYDINIRKNTIIKEINKEQKRLVIEDSITRIADEIKYDKVIITEEDVTRLPKMFGMKSQNIFKIDRFNDIQNINEYVAKTGAKIITIVGATYFGLLTALNYSKKGYDVVIIEENKKYLDQFDDEFSYLIKEELIRNNINVFTGSGIYKLIKNLKDHVSQIQLKNDVVIKTHLVIFFTTPVPYNGFATKTGLSLNESGRIIVNEKMESTNPDFYAAGCIAGSFNYTMKSDDYADLPGPCRQQARIAASNACGYDLFFKGILNTKIIKIGKFTVAQTGINVDIALNNNMEAYPLTLFAGNKERFSPGAKQIHLKIIVDKTNKLILGAQACSYGEGVDKKTDIIATAIYANLGIDELSNLELSYAPDLSTAVDPINTMGMMAYNQSNGLSNVINISDIDLRRDFFILDVRNENEKRKFHVDNSIWIPLSELRSRISEIPHQAVIYIYSHVGRRGYIAERILKGNGFEEVYNIQGGITSIKIETNLFQFRESKEPEMNDY